MPRVHGTDSAIHAGCSHHTTIGIEQYAKHDSRRLGQPEKLSRTAHTRLRRLQFFKESISQQAVNHLGNRRCRESGNTPEPSSRCRPVNMELFENPLLVDPAEQSGPQSSFGFRHDSALIWRGFVSGGSRDAIRRCSRKHSATTLVNRVETFAGVCDPTDETIAADASLTSPGRACRGMAAPHRAIAPDFYGTDTGRFRSRP